MTYLSTKEVATMTGRPESVVSSWYQAGKLHAEKQGNSRRLLFVKEDVEEFMEQGKHIVKPREDIVSLAKSRYDEADKQKAKIHKLGSFCIANNIRIQDLHDLVWQRNERDRKRGLFDE